MSATSTARPTTSSCSGTMFRRSAPKRGAIALPAPSSTDSLFSPTCFRQDQHRSTIPGRRRNGRSDQRRQDGAADAVRAHDDTRLDAENRLVVPPMVHYRCEAGHTCGTFHVVHLGRYALGGFGLVFVEVTAVEEVGLTNEHDMGLWNDAQAESFKPLIAFMKRQGTAIGIQIGHGGRKSSSQSAMQGMGPLTEANIKAGAKVWQPVGPTAEPVADGWLTPRALTTAECKAMPETWAGAARRAVAAGFDTIEVHTAHGYLLASFLSPVSNTRNDEYGGDRAGRMRLPLEIVEAVRREMPETMPLFVRVSAVDGAQNGWNLDDTVAFARELKVRGVDVIDCSSGGISGSATAAQVPRGLGFQVPYAERVRNEVGIASMAVSYTHLR